MTDSQKWMVLAVTGISFGLLYLLTPILMPFIVAAFLAYLGDPVVDQLETRGMNRTLGVVLVFTLMALALGGVLFFLIPLLEGQIAHFFVKLPHYIQSINSLLIPWLEGQFGLAIESIDLSGIHTVVEQHWQEAGGIMTTVVDSVSESGAVIFQWLMNLLLVPVVTFYLLRDWDLLVAKVQGLVPRKSAPYIRQLTLEIDGVLAAFMRGQFYVMLVLGIIYSAGLTLVGLDLAVLIGMTAGLVSFVPYLGSIVGVVIACIAVIVQFQDIAQLMPVLAVFGVGQVIEGMLLTPWLVGDKIGLHPVTVIFAVLAGGQLFGFIGILIALPVASVIRVLFDHAHEKYTGSEFYRVKSVTESKRDLE
ncbi:MAG TPA: AI-2E family transporter [Methylococcales bacterium]|nr:AI-2E family transporter [Methylococcaceae bacterium]HIN67916.1 AI-2E family transporter [Methylococcales bacterium]